MKDPKQIVRSYSIKLMIIIIVISMGMNSCIEDDEFDIPDTSEMVVDAPENTINLQSIINQYESTFAGRPPEPITFDESDGFIEGYVISSDEGGNFFRELIIQNAAQNPTAGINIQVDVNPLFTRFNVGRKVYVKLEGLTLGELNGVYTLGLGEDLEGIQASRVDDIITRDEETVEITPRLVAIEDLRESLENQWIELTNVQFADSEIGKTFASEQGDVFDGDRLLRTCTNFFNAPIVFQTSTFADFKALTIPDGSGRVQAILSRDFRDDFFVLKANSPESLLLQETRCDFPLVSCGTASSPGINILIDEDFNSGSVGAATMPAGWTNYIESGSAAWENYFDVDINSRATLISNFNTDDVTSIAWLITPQLDFDAQTGEVLTFFTSNAFPDLSTLEVLFSDNWNGSPTSITSATWKPLADAVIVDNSDSFASFIFSGNISLDCVQGTGAIAFKYVGSEADGGGTNGQSNGTYELDLVRLTSN